MSTEAPKPGSEGWMDLTVENATDVAHFYRDVVGYQLGEVDMGGYSDFTLMSPSGDVVGGVCHARGPNANLPPVWLMYFTVVDLDASLTKAGERGGKLQGSVRQMGEMGRMALVQDPAGASCVLYEPKRG